MNVIDERVYDGAFSTPEAAEAFDHAFDQMLARWESARRAMFEIDEDGDPVA